LSPRSRMIPNFVVNGPDPGVVGPVDSRKRSWTPNGPGRLRLGRRLSW
jgi:hypothetical protein